MARLCPRPAFSHVVAYTGTRQTSALRGTVQVGGGMTRRTRSRSVLDSARSASYGARWARVLLSPARAAPAAGVHLESRPLG